MAVHIILFAVGLLNASFSAAQGPEDKYVQRGKDFVLDVKTSVELDESTDFYWKFQSSKQLNIARVSEDREIFFGDYKGRAKVFQNYSLQLKNAQNGDAGPYKAVVSGAVEQTVAEYKVIVQEEVSRVSLNVTSSSALDLDCDFNVTCSTVDFRYSSTYRCHMGKCAVVEELVPTGRNQNASITIFQEQGFLVCHHSNRVSVQQDRLEISAYCKGKSGTSAIAKICIGTCTGVLTAIVLVLTLKKCAGMKKNTRENNEMTEVAAHQDIHPAQSPYRCSGEEVSSSSPTTTYDVVKILPGPAGSTKPPKRSKSETVYAEVKKASPDDQS